jgi:hypothetical protein
MKTKIFALLALLIMSLGIVACSRQEVGGQAGTFEEAPCPMDLPKSTPIPTVERSVWRLP